MSWYVWLYLRNCFLGSNTVQKLPSVYGSLWIIHSNCWIVLLSRNRHKCSLQIDLGYHVQSPTRLGKNEFQYLSILKKMKNTIYQLFKYIFLLIKGVNAQISRIVHMSYMFYEVSRADFMQSTGRVVLPCSQASELRNIKILTWL